MSYSYYIDDGAHPGQTNMDRDEALFEWAKKIDFDGIVIRFYNFSPPCLSLGRFQREEDLKIERTKELGFDIVKRPTGGRAVLHQHEITYSVVFNWKRSIFSGNIRESYYKISLIFQKALKDIGLDTELAKIIKNDYQNKTDCFESPSYFEMTYKGKKIMGSAQMRKRDFCLQHGSLILKKETKNYCEIYGKYEDYPEINIDISKFKSSVIETIENEYDILFEKTSYEDLTGDL